jgi:hypothetical protein
VRPIASSTDPSDRTRAIVVVVIERLRPPPVA